MTEQNFDEQDVAALLARDTQDGPGTHDTDSLPPGDFESFATDDVELQE